MASQNGNRIVDSLFLRSISSGDLLVEMAIESDGHQFSEQEPTTLIDSDGTAILRLGETLLWEQGHPRPRIVLPKAIRVSARRILLRLPPGDEWGGPELLLQFIWIQAAAMSVPRAGHRAARLPDGRVIVMGGYNASSLALSSSEIYDPASSTWSPTDSLKDPRVQFTATVLADGRVLVVGGISSSNVLFECEIYDPTTETWAPTGNLPRQLAMHEAVLLSDGRVLVAGGFASPIAACFLFDPSVGQWSTTGSMASGRTSHALTRLGDGRVLASGGQKSGAYASCEIFDPATGRWSPTGSLIVGRAHHSATLLPDGRVLAAGGRNPLANPVDTTVCEIYDPSTGTWTQTTSLVAGRSGGASLLYGSAFVLMTGGGPDGGSCVAFDPATEAWTNVDRMRTGRAGHTTTELMSGQVLAAGGSDRTGAFLASSELTCTNCQPSWKYTGSLRTPRLNHGAVLMADGRVLVAGGQNNQSDLDSCEIYDPRTGRWTGTTSLHSKGVVTQCILLRSGRVLLHHAGVPGNMEVYNPLAATWRQVPSPQARDNGRLALLPNGRVLSVPITLQDTRCELFDESTDTWMPTGSLLTATSSADAVLLSTGVVLRAGGTGMFGGQFTQTYDPATGQWTQVADPTQAFSRSTMIPLQNGEALLFGASTSELYRNGQWGALPWAALSDVSVGVPLHDGSALAIGGIFGGVVDRCLLYRQGMPGWSPTAPLNVPRVDHTATVLRNGKVLVVGGRNDIDGPLASAEIYSYY